MNNVIRFIFYDQLSQEISSLKNLDKIFDHIVFIETKDQFMDLSHHKKKIAFIISSMRHFAIELSNQGYKVIYLKMDDEPNSQNLLTEFDKIINNISCKNIILTKPNNYNLSEKINFFLSELKISSEIREDNRFLTNEKEFQKWANNKKQLRMEYFYREVRKKYNILMDKDGKPEGGIWNFDTENREPPLKQMKFPKRISFKKDEITISVLNLVKTNFSSNFGTIDNFYFSVTREQALIEAKHFINNILPLFGKYQDAMLTGEAYLYHSLLSSYLNVGLLLPLELCQMAENSYRANNSPINSVEGFIRQIAGWREFIRGIYWHFMPNYKQNNFLNSNNKLPSFYWNGQTKMSCIKEVVSQTDEHAYSHHIQRLMITGNFGLIAGINPQELSEWYLAVYADAHEWVETPNTLGMALYADGGVVASKPYAASGKYINKMSNFCKNCYYNQNEVFEEKSCPFNSLYWNFIDKHQHNFRTNQRMKFIYSVWDKFDSAKQIKIKARAEYLLNQMKNDIL